MSTLYITEFTNMAGIGSRFVNVAPLPPVAEQTVTISGSSTQSNAFNAATQMIRLVTDATCSISVGANPTAATTNARISANVEPEYFAVQPGQKLAVITNS